jgi:putative transposase
MADNGVVSSMSREKTYRSRNEARADVFDYIERFYNRVGRHSTIGYLSPIEFERQVGLA